MRIALFLLLALLLVVVTVDGLSLTKAVRAQRALEALSTTPSPSTGGQAGGGSGSAHPAKSNKPYYNIRQKDVNVNAPKKTSGRFAKKNSSAFCAAAPASPQSVSYPPGLKSALGVTPASITFYNAFNGPIQLIWVDGNGKELPYQTLQPKQGFTQGTWITHAWVARNPANGALLQMNGNGDYIVAGASGNVCIGL